MTGLGKASRRLGRRIQGLGKAIEDPRRLARRLRGVGVDEDVVSWAKRPYVAGKSIRTVLDVGANTGQFMSTALVAFPGAYIHSFEPLRSALGELRQKAAASGGRVCVHPLALSDFTGTVQIREAAFAPASSVLKPGPDASRAGADLGTVSFVESPCMTLDAWASSVPLERPIVLKVDVQGYEAHVLRGAPSLLAQTDLLLIEVSNVELYEGMPSLADLASLVEPFGLRFLEVLGVVRELSSAFPLWQDVVFGRVDKRNPGIGGAPD